MSSNIINYVRPVQGQNRKDINRLLEALSDYSSPPVEEAGFQQRITVTPHAKVRDTDVRFGGVDWPLSETKDRGTRLMQKKVPNTPDTTPFDETWDSWGRRTIEYSSTIHNIGSNNFRYYDMTNVTDYVIQAGDWLEFDLYQFDNGAVNNVSFDFECNTPSAQSLRGSGINDQNGLSGHPSTDLLNWANDKWYHRKFDLTGQGTDLTGYNIYRYLIANENDSSACTAWIKNINITDGASTVRKVIFQDAVQTYSLLHNASALNVTHSLTDAVGFGVVNPFMFPTNDTKYGGRCRIPPYLWIPHHTLMDSNDLTIAMFLKLPPTDPSVSTTTSHILNKSGSWELRVAAHATAPNQLEFFPYNPTAEPRVTYNYTGDTWFTLVISYDSTSGTKMYINGNSTPVDTETDSGNLVTNTNGITVGIGHNIGANRIPHGDNMEMAHLFIGSEPCTTGFQSNFHNGHLNTDYTDTDGVKEIFYKPLTGNFDYFNDASAGFAVT